MAAADRQAGTKNETDGAEAAQVSPAARKAIADLRTPRPATLNHGQDPVSLRAIIDHAF